MSMWTREREGIEEESERRENDLYSTKVLS